MDEQSLKPKAGLLLQRIPYRHLVTAAGEWKREAGSDDPEFLESVERIADQDALFGGRTNALQLFYTARPGERIDYNDFTSLSPYVNKYLTCPNPPDIVKVLFMRIFLRGEALDLADLILKFRVQETRSVEGFFQLLIARFSGTSHQQILVLLTPVPPTQPTGACPLYTGEEAVSSMLRDAQIPLAVLDMLAAAVTPLDLLLIEAVPLDLLPAIAVPRDPSVECTHPLHLLDLPPQKEATQSVPVPDH
ncbi:hypothetical protein P4O66_000290 [Electrophorus voltai]|uniref:Uncharacterized protein n=1 Tax=Electrophorus voltai TaxID=2609070 RepID=A0AAD8ZKF3_9TELE|nr:hypothetical protein P4O66_000290 [Electrophorus voltai]